MGLGITADFAKDWIVAQNGDVPQIGMGGNQDFLVKVAPVPNPPPCSSSVPA